MNRILSLAICMASLDVMLVSCNQTNLWSVSLNDNNANIVFSGIDPIGHEYVDLGLPSGTLWATCNIGSTKPEEFGDYFPWEDISPKDEYNLNTYRWGIKKTVRQN